MNNYFDAFERAIQWHHVGRIAEAATLCRQLIEAVPDHAEAWHLLGVIALQTGNTVAAADCLQRVLTLTPDNFEAQNNLGIALRHMGKLEDAKNCFLRATELCPAHAQAHHNLANAQQELGNIDEAITGYRRALALDPANASYQFNLAKTLHQKGNSSEAAAAYGRAIELQPTNAEAHFAFANLCREHQQDAEAISLYRRAIELNPKHAEACSNLGVVLKNHDMLPEALACFRHAIELQPQNVELQFNMACIVNEQGELAAATELFDCVLAKQPTHAEARFNRALLSLQHGDFDRGWPEFEWRWRTEQLRPREFTQPRWNGEPLNGKTILLYAEQGLGDTFQFIRYAALVKRLGGTVLVECFKSQKKILSSYQGCDQLLAEGDELPPFDLQAPLLSLPGIFKTNIATMPAEVPYLFADPTLVKQWRQRLASIAGFRIGINWRGRPGRGNFRKRDIFLPWFEKLAAVPSVKLISLQQGIGKDDLLDHHTVPPIIALEGDVDNAHGPFMDTAAIMMNLDLVVTSDTSIAHLAGALGVPVWLALPFTAEWRWFLDRSDSPWYPTMKLFRQRAWRDWQSVFEAMQAELSELVRLRLNERGTTGAT